MTRGGGLGERIRPWEIPKSFFFRSSSNDAIPSSKGSRRSHQKRKKAAEKVLQERKGRRIIAGGEVSTRKGDPCSRWGPAKPIWKREKKTKGKRGGSMEKREIEKAP